MRELFPAEPLTAEQEARLPAAQALAAKVVPEGVYSQLIDDTLQVLMGPMMQMLSSDGMGAATLSLRLGVPQEDLATLSQAELKEITALLDPAFQQRREAAMTAMMVPLRDIMVAVEPKLHSGIARAYAIRFDPAELNAIGTFFATPAGMRFAGELLPLFSDPQVMSASMEMLPQIMERMPEMTKAITDAMAALPPQRAFADLSPAKRARLAALLNTDQATLKTSMTPPPVMIPAP